MTALEEFIAGLKRFLGFGTRSPAERIDEATQDRPPPETSVVETVVAIPVVETPVVEAPVEETVVETPAIPYVEDAPLELATELAAPATGSLVLTLATPPTTFTIAKSEATLGRGEDNTIRLDDLSVSRRHARITYRQSGYWLSDLGSMGGTWVGGTRLDAAHRVAADEVIDVGHYRLTVSFAGEPKTSTPRRRPSRAR